MMLAGTAWSSQAAEAILEMASGLSMESEGSETEKEPAPPPGPKPGSFERLITVFGAPTSA